MAVSKVIGNAVWLPQLKSLELFEVDRNENVRIEQRFREVRSKEQGSMGMGIGVKKEIERQQAVKLCGKIVRGRLMMAGNGGLDKIRQI